MSSNKVAKTVNRKSVGFAAVVATTGRAVSCGYVHLSADLTLSKTGFWGLRGDYD